MSCVCDSFGVFNLSETLVCLLLASTISKRLNVSGQKRFEKCFLKKHILRKHFEVFHPGTHDRNLGSGFAFDGATPLATIYFGILRNSLTFSPHSFFNSHFFQFSAFFETFPALFFKEETRKQLENLVPDWNFGFPLLHSLENFCNDVASPSHNGVPGNLSRCQEQLCNLSSMYFTAY